MRGVARDIAELIKLSGPAPMRIKKPPDPLDQQIGRNIRFHRMRKGLSQIALGRHIGIAYQQVQKYETAANRVPGSRLVHVARVLDVGVDALLGEQAVASDDAKADRISRSLEHRRRLRRAAAAISDERLLNLAIQLIEGIAGLPHWSK
jgi:transcriptional regulator with XRE-family HTH domain